MKSFDRATNTHVREELTMSHVVTEVAPASTRWDMLRRRVEGNITVRRDTKPWTPESWRELEAYLDSEIDSDVFGLPPSMNDTAVEMALGDVYRSSTGLATLFALRGAVPSVRIDGDATVMELRAIVAILERVKV